MTDKVPVSQAIKDADRVEKEIVPPDSALPPLEIPEIRSGRIYIILATFYLTAIAIRIFFLEGPSFISVLRNLPKTGLQIPPSNSILFGYFLYMSFACQFIPLPTLPVIAFTAKIFHPVTVSAIGALGTCIANLNDYAILGWLLRHKKVKKIRDIRTYRRLLSFFDRYAFATLSVAAFLPIPIDVVRLLAISRAYAYSKYILATFVGRFPRYLIIAYLGKELPVKYILILFLLSTIPATVKIISDIIKKRKSR